MSAAVPALILLFAVIFVNGWTDAPSAIASCVATRTLPVGRAVAMAATANLAGGLSTLWFGGAVASTVFAVADFGGEPLAALRALSAAMGAVVVWAVAAWRFGLPTSESHALIAALTGAAIALHGSLSGIRPAEWGRVLLGLAASTLPALVAALAVSALIGRICTKRDRRSSMRFFRAAQIGGAAAAAFSHGAQDGQKFMAVLMLILALARGNQPTSLGGVPVRVCLICAAVMAAGTLLGGGRIIRTVGMKMVTLDPAGGFAADLAAAVCVLGCTAAGLPVSTTHAKTCAMMGAGRRADRSVVRELALAWGLTFPVCGGLGWLFAAVTMIG